MIHAAAGGARFNATIDADVARRTLLRSPAGCLSAKALRRMSEAVNQDQINVGRDKKNLKHFITQARHSITAARCRRT